MPTTQKRSGLLGAPDGRRSEKAFSVVHASFDQDEEAILARRAVLAPITIVQYWMEGIKK
jgi:hypothetical protein